MAHGLRVTFCIFFGLVITFGASCFSKKSITLKIIGQTMGTHYQVTWESTPSLPPKSAVVREIEKRLKRVNTLMSTYDPESEISRFNNNSTTKWFPVSAETQMVVAEALSIADQSQGAFDISIGPVVNLWGFGPESRPEKVPSKAQLKKALSGVGYKKVKVRETLSAIQKKTPELKLDLSGIAKGYGVDVIAEYLQGIGIDNYLVDIGGELRAGGLRQGRKWRIVIEVPQAGARSPQRTVLVSDLSLATSGDYRNFFVEKGKRYSHMIDPRTGRPIEHSLASVSVLAKNCMQADGLATALMVLGDDIGYEVALKNKWSALFIIKTKEGFKELSTPTFERLIQ